MTYEKNEKGVPFPAAHRLTPVCKLIRSLCLDELPQLVNCAEGRHVAHRTTSTANTLSLTLLA